MKTKIYLTLLVCLSLMMLIGCAGKDTNSGDGKSINNSDTNIESKDNELLYGKYPEPILIAIGETNTCQVG